MGDILVLYHKVYSGKDEENPKKHTITQDQIEQFIAMMNSDDVSDVKTAVKILSNSNCNEYYEEIIWEVTHNGSNTRWRQRTSKDGINKRITRFI